MNYWVTALTKAAVSCFYLLFSIYQVYSSVYSEEVVVYGKRISNLLYMNGLGNIKMAKSADLKIVLENPEIFSIKYWK